MGKPKAFYSVEEFIALKKRQAARRCKRDAGGYFLTCWQLFADRVAPVAEHAFADRVAPVAEHAFAKPRKWRFDWAWPERKVAVEVDGGQWAPRGGRHAGDKDRDKLNHAAALGWRVLRFSPQQLKQDPAGAVALVLRALQ